MKSVFINEVFEQAVTDYLSSRSKIEGKLYNSFYVVVLRMLINIYGELDIINPYQTHNEEALMENLQKFGATETQINTFFTDLLNFDIIENRNQENYKKETNPYFISIQKELIDLFNLKRLNYGLTSNDRKEFFDLLYTPGTSNALRLSYNFLKAIDIYEIAEYYKKKITENNIVSEKDEKNILGFDVYKLFNLSISDISKMNNEEIDKLNSEIYKSFDISEYAINKDYLLKEKVKLLKMQNNPITTGNGYVDILLIMSVIVTTLMVIVIFSSLII